MSETPQPMRDSLRSTVIYSIGHSNHPPGDFLALLQENDIQLIVDVRSSPYSRYVPHANRETLSRALTQAGIGYAWLGDRLGGKPQGVIADYDQLRVSPAFQQGIADLLSLAAERRTAIMCSEGDYRSCHRYKLITPALLNKGACVLHIQTDGTLVDKAREPKQLSLF